MKALRCANKKLSVDDLPKPTSDGEAVVRVTLSGICNTDIEIARGYAGFEGTIGHEFVGVIESMSDDGALARPRDPRPGSPAGVGRLGRATVDEGVASEQSSTSAKVALPQGRASDPLQNRER